MLNSPGFSCATGFAPKASGSNFSATGTAPSSSGLNLGVAILSECFYLVGRYVERSVRSLHPDCPPVDPGVDADVRAEVGLRRVEVSFEPLELGEVLWLADAEVPGDGARGLEPCTLPFGQLTHALHLRHGVQE